MAKPHRFLSTFSSGCVILSCSMLLATSIVFRMVVEYHSHLFCNFGKKEIRVWLSIGVHSLQLGSRVSDLKSGRCRFLILVDEY